MLTIFSTCKPFVGEFKVIQTNAIKSWTKLGDKVEIILFGDEDGVESISKELKIKHIGKIKRNSFGTPYLNYMFKEAARIAQADILCYVNADIILLPGFLETIDFVKKLARKFLIVGRRWEIEIKEFIDYSNPRWHINLKKHTTENGKLSVGGAIDYFIFTKDLYKNIPPFLVGRVWWDTYLAASALLKTIYVFDATEAIFAIHQNHSYKHHPQSKWGVWRGEEAQYNIKLYKNSRLPPLLGNAKRAFFKIQKHNNSFKIKLNIIGIIKIVFAYIRELARR